MPRDRSLVGRLGRCLAWHQALHDPEAEPRNRNPWLPEVRRWQGERLRLSFARFLRDPQRRPAAEFFLGDLYGDHDFTRRDADVARVLPRMQRLLPAALLETVTDAIELGALTHSLDLQLAEALTQLGTPRGPLDAELYGHAYRKVGHRRLRRQQIDLVGRVGRGLGHALHHAGVATLLKLSRTPARLAGFGALQAFLERGFAAYAHVGDIDGFIAEIEAEEREAVLRLFAAHPDPFRLS